MLVETSGLTRTFGSVRALDGLDLALSPGAIGLVGANGAGKTTLFRILLGLSKPDAGTVRVLDTDVLADPVTVRTRLGFMPEHDCLPTDQSAADVVATLGEIGGLPARAARQRASDVCDLVGLDEARFRPIEGYSTGMRQRAKLAQALVGDPTLVLLDEPTAGLDPLGREQMLELVGRLAGFGISVILATHLLEDVERVCDQVVMLDAGRLVAAGRTADLLADTGSVTIDVGVHGRELADRLGPGSTVEDDGTVSVTVTDDAGIDAIVGLIADAGLPLHRLSNRRSSLDDVFRAGAGSNR